MFRLTCISLKPKALTDGRTGEAAGRTGEMTGRVIGQIAVTTARIAVRQKVSARTSVIVNRMNDKSATRTVSPAMPNRGLEDGGTIPFQGRPSRN